MSSQLNKAFEKTRNILHLRSFSTRESDGCKGLNSSDPSGGQSIKSFRPSGGPTSNTRPRVHQSTSSAPLKWPPLDFFTKPDFWKSYSNEFLQRVEISVLTLNEWLFQNRNICIESIYRWIHEQTFTMLNKYFSLRLWVCVREEVAKIRYGQLI